MKFNEILKSKLKVIICYASPTLLSKYLYYKSRGKKINLKNPILFDEKITWLKLNNYVYNPLVWKCCDKYYMREYAKDCRVSENNLVPLLGVYNSADEIDFDKLPQKFVLKCSHGCGYNIICENKSLLDINYIRRQLNTWKKTKYGYETAEIQYNHIEPKIICEEFIDCKLELPYDYKIYCFNGIPKCVLVCSEREKKLKLNFYDLNWNELSLGKEEFKNKKTINKPKTFESMLSISKKVANKFPFVRVDFYEYKNKAILGELTFTPGACVADYYSDYGEDFLGKLLTIDLLNHKYKNKMED